MPQHILLHQRGVGIGVAIPAEVSAGIIGADVCSQQAGTFPASLVLPPWRVEVAAQRLFVQRDCHTSAAIRAIALQIIALRSGTKRHTGVICYLDHLLTQLHFILMCQRPERGKVSLDFLIQVDE